MSIDQMTSAAAMLFARIGRDRSGAAATEFALLFPILALLLAGLIDFSRLISHRMQVQAAAQAGADYVIRHGWNADAVSRTIAGAASIVVTADPAPKLVSGCISGTEVLETTASTCPTGFFVGKFVFATARASFRPLMPWPAITVPDTIVATALTRVQ